jgi:cell division control protein 6
VAKKLTGFFKNFLDKDIIFNNKKVLQSSYTPDELVHRDEQIDFIAQIVAPALKLDRPSNLFIYGKTGTGKTLSVKYTSNEMLNVAKEQDIPLKIFYINCKLKKVADTEYRLIAELIRSFGKPVPATGLPTDEIYNIFYQLLDSKEQVVILVLDEIDQLIKKAGDEIIYNLTRINSELKNAQISIIGISNDLIFSDNLDPRVKSSLSEEEIVFPPYNAIQIQDILNKRAKVAFKENVIGPGVIPKCAAYAAREHGDARRALELLRVAGEIAERKSLTKITLKELDKAESKIERDRIVEIVTTQPKQYQATLYCAFKIAESTKEKFFTGDIYDLYKKLSRSFDLRPLTQRRISDIIAELDMLGLINAKVISKGRYGRTREISLSLPSHMSKKVKKILEDSLGVSDKD